MAKSSRNEAWHDTYKVIFNKLSEKDPVTNPTGAPRIRMTRDEVAVCMGVSKRDVCRIYPDGWRNNGDGNGRGKTIRLDTLLDQEFGTY